MPAKEMKTKYIFNNITTAKKLQLKDAIDFKTYPNVRDFNVCKNVHQFVEFILLSCFLD